MSSPRGHHFVPQLLLRRWAGEDDRVLAWMREPNSKVKCFPVLPSETAHERDLYARSLVPPEDRDAIEKGFFAATVEARAGPAIEAAVRGGLSALKPEQVVDLALFMIASRVRLPEHVHRARKEGRAFLEAALSCSDLEFDEINTGPEQTPFEWLVRHYPATVENFGINVIPMVITHGSGTEKLLRMPWWLFDASQATREVLLSDRPLVALEGIDHPQHVQALPLGPRHVLFAARAPESLDKLRSRPPSELVRAFNQSVVGQARRFAYGRAERAFIERNLPDIPG